MVSDQSSRTYIGVFVIFKFKTKDVISDMDASKCSNKHYILKRAEFKTTTII